MLKHSINTQMENDSFSTLRINIYVCIRTTTKSRPRNYISLVRGGRTKVRRGDVRNGCFR